MITSPTDSLIPHLPKNDFGSTSLDVQTNDGVAKLTIIRDSGPSYVLIFSRLNKDTKVWEEKWRSNSIPTPEAVDGIWFLCWTHPGGFLP